MQHCNNYEELYKTTIIPDNRWNNDHTKPLLMHSIHVYPAKFPPMVAEQAFRYAEEEGVVVNKVADIFCGCGTVALESKKRSIPFWGCDINPVAILISKTKTYQYELTKLYSYYDLINNNYAKYVSGNCYNNCYVNASERLKYWFNEKTYKDLYCLKTAIDESVDDQGYLNAFQCAFSSILKTASKWLQKSIKPQIDPNKKEVDIKLLFDQKIQKFFKAVKEIHDNNITDIESIVLQTDLFEAPLPDNIDLIITSPPYVTSYEYADLHQLSSLWLGYTDDYKKLRKGSIGSTHNIQEIDLNKLILNSTGSRIINELLESGVDHARIKSIARYYCDMERVVSKTKKMMNKNGMALFVIGDSELRGVKLLNSIHLVETMRDCGFDNIKIGKRTIEKSMCVPFRDARGKFTNQQSSKNEIYHEEFVVSGRII